MIAARALVPAALGALGLLLLAYLWKSGGDARLYWEYGGRLLGRSFVPGYVEWVQHGIGTPDGLDHAVPGAALAPYTGFAAEYPPGALLLFEAVRLPVDQPFAFGRAFAAVMAGCVALMAVCAVRLRAILWGADRGGAWLAAGALLLWPVLIGRGFLVGRFDIVPAALTLAALLLHARGRSGWAALVLGLGGAVKLWPLLAVPLLMLDLASRRELRTAVVAAAAGVWGFVLPHLVMLAQGTAPADLLRYLTYLRDRPVELEAVIASAAMAVLPADALMVARDFGSINLLFPGDRQWIAAASAANGVLLVLVYALFWRQVVRSPDPRARLEAALAACGAIAVAMVACSRVYSGEYVIWFMPFALVLAGRRGGWLPLAAYFAALLLLRLMYRHWNELSALGETAILILALKNLATLATGAAFLRPLLRRSPALEQAARPRDMAPIAEGHA